MRNAAGAREDDLAVGLDGDGTGEVAGRAECGGDFPARAETGVERAVRVVPRQGDIEVGARDDRLAGRDDLAVRLNRDGLGRAPTGSEVGRHFAVQAEGRVESAVGPIAEEGEARVTGPEPPEL